MKRFFFLLLALVLAAGVAVSANAAAVEVPEEYQARFRQEIQSAIANVKARAPGQSKLIVETRGTLIEGYEGTKSDNSLSVYHTVSKSVAKVDEEVKFAAYVNCTYPPTIYNAIGMIFDTNFGFLRYFGRPAADLNGDGELSEEEALKDWREPSADQDPNFYGVGRIGKLAEPGYICWVFMVLDGLENPNVVALTTNTVQIVAADDEETLFENVGVDTDPEGAEDNKLGVNLALDRSKLAVGDPIIVSVEFTTTCDPITYRGVWLLVDENGTVIDEESTGQLQVNAQAAPVTKTFEYRPMKAGRLQFQITAEDGEGRSVKNNTAILTVQDGFYIAPLRFNRYAPWEVTEAATDSKLTATYAIYGHECEGVAYYTGWKFYDNSGQTLKLITATVEESSGTSSVTPRIGVGVQFYVGAICDHFPNSEPARIDLPIINGLLGEVSLTASTVVYGESVGVNYEFDGGLTPYEVQVTGYSCDTERNKTYTFIQKTLADETGTVTGVPQLGDQVYFEVKLVESDGHTTTWKTGKIPLTGAPVITSPWLEAASVTPTSLEPGQTVTLTYHMRGGSGTLDKSGTAESYVEWKKSNGTVIHRETLTEAKGTASFTPTETGKYTCELHLADAYFQQVEWQSSAITVEARIPGDADGNNVVNIYDALKVMQHCSGWSSATVDKSNADVDGSGTVTVNDAVLILRWCAGEGVTLQ